MKTYDKQKLNEYAKELFALCLEKEINISYNPITKGFTIYNAPFAKEKSMVSYVCSDLFKHTDVGHIWHIIPIWKLIEKVKAL